jgi:hypothetical protein
VSKLPVPGAAGLTIVQMREVDPVDPILRFEVAEQVTQDLTQRLAHPRNCLPRW